MRGVPDRHDQVDRRREGIPGLVFSEVVLAAVGEDDKRCAERLSVVLSLSLNAIWINGKTLCFDHGLRVRERALEQVVSAAVRGSFLGGYLGLVLDVPSSSPEQPINNDPSVGLPAPLGPLLGHAGIIPRYGLDCGGLWLYLYLTSRKQLGIRAGARGR
jgi:hypothetical protein